VGIRRKTGVRKLLKRLCRFLWVTVLRCEEFLENFQKWPQAGVATLAA